MPRYEFRTVETIQHQTDCVVEAANEAEAREKAEKGDKEKETDVDYGSVVSRVIIGGPRLLDELIKKPIVVCLCGSTRFVDTFREQNLKETLAGRIVLSIGCDFKSDHALGLEPDVTALADGAVKNPRDYTVGELWMEAKQAVKAKERANG